LEFDRAALPPHYHSLANIQKPQAGRWAGQFGKYFYFIFNLIVCWVLHENISQHVE
jgi:hypothetical protein